MNTIKCQKCGTDIELDKALAGEIEARLLTQINEQHQNELLLVKSDAEAASKKLMSKTLKIELEKYKQEIDLETERMKSKLENKAHQDIQKQELLIEKLSSEAEISKQTNDELRQELKKLTEAMMNEQKERENAELNANKRLLEEAAKIKEETQRHADESHRFKEMELQKQLSDTKAALDSAMRKAEQSSTQIQGEVLELELENSLRREFPADIVTEVKKGANGADVVQVVKNNRSEECGVLLWESKNAIWQQKWVAKLQDDIVAANASIGIIVATKMPDNCGDMFNIESNIWVVKPCLAIPLAAALRSTIIQVYTANRFSAGKDEKMEHMYKYLTGPEFSNRIRVIIDNYKILQDEIEKERRSSSLRWGRQEKAIRSVIDNTFGFYGDVQGLLGCELQEAVMIGSECECESE